MLSYSAPRTQPARRRNEESSVDRSKWVRRGERPGQPHTPGRELVRQAGEEAPMNGPRRVRVRESLSGRFPGSPRMLAPNLKEMNRDNLDLRYNRSRKKGPASRQASRRTDGPQNTA